MFRAGPSRSSHIAEVDRPTFLTRAHGRVYGVSEVGAGRVFQIGEAPPGATSPGTLSIADPQGRPVEDGLAGEPMPSGGAHPCHIAASPDEQWLYVAHYSDGLVRAIQLESDGHMGTTVDLTHAGHGVDPQRQTGPHAHFCTVVGHELVIADLGTDSLRVHQLDGGRPDTAAHVVDMPAGSGPRHIATSGSHLYVAGELDGTITVVDHTTWQVVDQVPAATVKGSHHLSHIEVIEGWVIVGVRVANTLSLLTPQLTIAQQVPTTSWPRHFAYARTETHEGLIVAGERSNELVHHPIHWADGELRLGEVQDRLGIPTPMFVGVEDRF